MIERFTLRRSVAALGTAFILAAAGLPADGAFDAFIKFESPGVGAGTVSGESEDSQFPGNQGWSEVLAFSYGILSTVDVAGGTGGAAASVPQLSSFNLTRQFDSGSVALFKACATGGSYDTVELALRTSGNSAEAIPPFYTAKLKDVFVSSVNWSGASGGADRPSEEVSLDYGAIEWTYTRFSHDGTPVHQTVHWDLATASGGPGPLPSDVPQIQCPADKVLSTDPGQCSARAVFDVSATDDSGTPAIGCVPPSGSIFPRGTTQVQCTATDAGGLSTTCTFSITVQDKELPIISLNGSSTLVVECHTSFSDPGASASDNCDGDLTSAIRVTGTVDPNTVGSYVLRYNVSDSASLAAAEVTRTVQVVDTTPPTISCPLSVAHSTDPGKCSAVITFTVTANDLCSGTVVPICVPRAGSTFQRGDTTVNCTATDAAGLTAQCAFPVTVTDTEAPTIAGVSVDKPTLWPPDHTLRDVTVSYTATDNCDVTSSLQVKSSEAQARPDPGDTKPQFEIVDAHHVRLLAERSSAGPGRTYTITITATDAAGNSAAKDVLVQVPHDNSSAKK